MKIIKQILLLAVAFSFAATGSAQVERIGDENEPPTYKMTVSPAAEPKPALKYHFLTPPVDQVEGNAATFYYKSMIIEGPDYLRELWSEPLDEKVKQWLEMRPDKLPLDEIRQKVRFLTETDSWISLVEAARQNHCEWGDPVREYGAITLLPQAQKMRCLGVAIALKARTQLAQQKYSDAIDTLRLGYALSRNMGHGFCLVECLVGMAIAAKADDQTRTLMAAADSPNLYWALTELAAEPVDLRQAYSYERRMWEFTFHELNDLENRTFSESEINELAEKLWKNFKLLRSGDKGATKLPDPASWSIELWPEAQKYLLENGYKKEQLQAMPKLQGAMLYRWKQYQIVRDDYYKWAALPDDEARRGLETGEEQYKAAIRQDIGEPFSGALGAVYRASITAQLRHLRQTNMLRAIEALRMYAAEKESWPEKLSDVKTVPVPNDPYTEEPFEYSLKDGVATLSTPHDKTWNVASGAARYELTLRTPAK